MPRETDQGGSDPLGVDVDGLELRQAHPARELD